jgi:TonB-dependent receptor
MPFGIRPFLKYLACLALALAFLMSGEAFAASNSKRKVKVDLPAGLAAESLRVFAAQSQLQIVFPTNLLKGARSPRIKGRYVIDEALELILENTDLTSIRDEQSGAYFIKESVAALSTEVGKEVVEEIKPKPNQQTDTNKPTNMNSNTQEKPKFARKVFKGLLSIALLGGVQTATAQDDDVPTYELDKLEVFSSTQESSVKKQRDSDIIGTYLSGDALGNLPDTNLGEALSRLAGINVVDGGSVTVRGAEGQYNSIRINGAAQANAQLGSRNFDVTQIPSEMVAGVEVIKSLTAEHPGDSIGGYVNVITANAFDRGDNLTTYKLSSRYRDQGSKSGYGVNIINSNIFSAFGGDDNLGVLVNFNYVDEDRVGWSTQNRFLTDAGRLSGADSNQISLNESQDATTPIWNRFDPNEVRRTGDNLTLDLSFDLKVSDNTSLYFRPLYQTFDDSRDSFAFRFDRLERAFSGNFWFMDDAGNALGTFEEDDDDPVLGSAGDDFIHDVDASGNLIVTPNFEASRDGRFSRIISGDVRSGDTYTFDFGGETELANGTLEYRALYSTDDSLRFRRQWRFEERTDDGDRDGSGKSWLRTSVTNGGTPLPEFSVFEVTEKRGHVPVNNKVNVFSDLNRYNSNGGARFLLEDVHEDVQLFNVEYDHEVDEGFSIKSGLRLRKAHRDNVTNEIFTAASAGSRRVFPVGQFAAASNAGNFTLFDGKYADIAGPFVTADPAYDFFFEDLAANPDNWEFDRSDLRDAADTGELNEDIFAAYVQGTKRWGDFTLVAGVRYEETSLDTTWKPSNFRVDAEAFPGLTVADKSNIGQLIQNGLDDIGFTGQSGTFSFGDIVDDINEKNSYNNLLPSAVGTYRVGETGHLFRFAYGNTLTRPDYRELIPFNLGEANRQLQAAGVLNLTNRDEEFDLGNPNLREQTSENLDLAWEYYFGPRDANTISVSLFSKDLEDFLQEDTFTREIEVLVDADDPSLGTEMVRADTNFWTNASTRHIEGFEVSGYFSFADLLPDVTFLSGFKLVPNYSYIVGDQTDPIFNQDELELGNFVVDSFVNIPSLRNQAKEIYNMQIIYEWQRLSVRASYNYISELQVTASTAAISDITFDTERENVDISVQYRISKDKDLRLFIEGDNLTDSADDEKYIGNTTGLFTTSYATVGRRFVAGIRGSF